MQLKRVTNWSHQHARRFASATMIRVGHDFIVVEDPRTFAHELLRHLDSQEQNDTPPTVTPTTDGINIATNSGAIHIKHSDALRVADQIVDHIETSA